MAMPPGLSLKSSSVGGAHGSSPRSSPFRRPESPASPLPLRFTPSPSKAGQVNSNSRLSASATISSTPTSSTASLTPKAPPTTARATTPTDDMYSSPRPVRPAMVSRASTATMGHSNALSQLQASQVRTLREGFQILDRDSDGIVGREDVADMLKQLGLPSGAADVSQFFPPSTPQTISMAAFLNMIASVLASLSPSAEMLSAFSAFDDDDSGQVDLAELRDALLHTAPEPGERALTAMEVDEILSGFTGKRAFSKNKQGGFGKRGEVFRYQDFVNSVANNNSNPEATPSEDSEA